MSEWILTEDHVAGVCRPRTASCCRYLGRSTHWVCFKLTDLKPMLDRRVAEGSIRATGDNCDGMLSSSLGQAASGGPSKFGG